MSFEPANKHVQSEEGWRMLAEGEVIREGDEYGGDGRGKWNWTPTNNPTLTVRRGDRYRRRVVPVAAPADEWMLLNVGDVICEGDEFLALEERELTWQPVITTVGQKLKSKCAVFRRRVKKPEAAVAALLRQAAALLRDAERDYSPGIVLTAKEIEWLTAIRKLPWSKVQSEDIPGGILARLGGEGGR